MTEGWPDPEKLPDAFRDVGVDQVIVHMQMGGVPHADIVESIEAFGELAIPRYE
jgi:hypothetical protein